MKRLVLSALLACFYASPAHSAVDCEAKPTHPQCSGSGDLETRVEALENLLRPKMVFVTSTTYSGNLGGLVGADAACQAHADSASLGGTFRAWLSTSTVNAKDRILPTIAPYVQPNGDEVTTNFYGDLVTAIDVDEHGDLVTPTEWVWTGTLASPIGDASAATCSDWTTASSGVSGTIGHAEMTDSSWTEFADVGCHELLRLYCFQYSLP